MLRRFLATLAVAAALAGSPLSAKDLFVHNRLGSDMFDGTSPTPINVMTGPARTIKRAIQVAEPGDRIRIVDTGQPYYESLSFVGSRLSGSPASPVVVDGGGATLSGERRLPQESWYRVRDGLWRFSPPMKGFFALYRDRKPLAGGVNNASDFDPATVEPGRWAMNRGTVYYRQEGTIEPTMEEFTFAADAVGITVYGTAHLRIENLVVERFQLDGVAVPNLSEDIEFLNVTSRENGRAGFSAGGTAKVRLTGCTSQGNLAHSVLIGGRSAVEVTDENFSADPTVLP